MSRDEYRAFVQDAERMVQMHDDYREDFELWESEFWAQFGDTEGSPNQSDLQDKSDGYRDEEI